MDELERSLARLRRAVVDEGVRAVVERRPVDAPRVEPRRAAAAPGAVPPASLPLRTPPPRPAAGTVWPRIRLPVLAVLSGLLAVLLVL